MPENIVVNMCRTCMATDVHFLPLFESGLHTKNIHFQSLAECLVAFTEVEIEKGDGLPSKICAPCASQTVELYNFKEKCKRVDQSLRKTFIKNVDNANAVEAVIIKPELPLEEENVTNEENPVEVEYIDAKEGLYVETVIEEVPSQPTSTKDEPEEAQENLIVTEKQNLIEEAEVEVVERMECIQEEEIEPYTESVNEVEVVTLPNDELIPNLEEEPSIQDKVECVLIENETEEIYRCQMCDVVCTFKSDFDKHLATHIRRKNQCHLCDKSFIKPSHLTRHLITHEVDKPYNCKECNKGFARFTQYTHHMNKHTGVKPHICKECGKGFNQISNLKDHLRTHNGEKPFLCSVCGKGFNQLGNLRQHTVRHSGVKAHLCNICGTGFASKGELSAHTRKHTGAKPFVCNICSHGFTTSSSLTKHKRIHSGEKPYECEVCKMRFSRSGILSRHRRTHTGEKPYTCPHCARAFAQSNDLASHLRIHTGERPYVCVNCGQAFRQSSALKTHMKLHRRAEIKSERNASVVLATTAPVTSESSS